jgi:uncharacterized repeat protein (TIGR03943 family)
MLHFANLPFSNSLFSKSVARWSHLFTGRVDAFLIPTFRPYVLIAGLVLGIMALVFALFPADAECCATSDCSHPLSRFRAGKWLAFLVLLVPFTATAFFSPDNFGKDAITNRHVVTDASTLPKMQSRASTTTTLDLPLPTKDGSTAAPASPAAAAAPATGAQAASAANDYLERTAEGYIVAEVLDLLYAAQDSNLRKDFDGKTVQLIGQLMPDTTNNPSGTRFKAVRMFMTCCAADARPVATLVEGVQAPTLPEMTWIKIVGKATFPVENGKRTAVLKAERVEKVDPPAETMLY